MRRDYRRRQEKKARAFEGFEAWTHSLQMSAKMVLAIFFASALLYWSVFYLLFWAWTWFRDPEAAHNLVTFLKAFALKFLSPSKPLLVRQRGQVFWAPARAIYEVWAPSLWPWLGMVTKKGLTFFPPFVILFFLGSVRRFREKAAREMRDVEVIRGPELISPGELSRRLRKKHGKGRLKLVRDVTLPRELENRHVFAVGATGTGKTTFLKNLLSQLRKGEKGEKVMIFDLKGEYLSVFFDPERDKIFCPLDARSEKWTIIRDVHGRRDLFDFARAFIPSAVGEGLEKFFRDAARDLFASILEVAKEREWDNEKVARLILEEDVGKIAEMVKGRPGYAYISIPESRQAAGVHATLVQYVRILEWLKGQDGNFSFRKWVSEGEGFLFLPVPPQYRSLLAPLVTAVVNLVIREVLGFPDDPGRRVWIVVDELAALHKLPALIDGLTLGRSKGLCLCLGAQDFGKLDEVYGRSMRETIWNNARTKMVLRVEAPQTAQYLSESLGKTEISVAAGETFSLGVEDHRDGISLSRREELKYLVLVSEIQDLPDLVGYLKIGGFPPAKVEVLPVDLKPRIPGLEPREDPPVTHRVSGEEEEKISGEESGPREEEVELY